MYVQVPTVLYSQTEVTDVCELPDVSAKNQTQVLSARAASDLKH